jgi:TolB-like protein/AraC-like DNA-binding protein/Tfp pilus assembly protein PilF
MHPTPTKTTIAVLPFVNMSASQENEYFSDGITEEIINALAKIEGLKVTSRTSAFYFKGKNLPIAEIGAALGVSTILEGSVRLAGQMMRITAQLIDVAEDFHFWSETWDRKLDDIFAVQDEVSLLIADKLREHIGHFELQEHLVAQQDWSVEAHQLFLRGRQVFNKWNPEDAFRAVGYYEQALKLAPNHAEAMVGLADAYSFLGTVTAIPFEEGWAKSAELTHQALAINEELPAAYYQLANLAFFTQFDYREAFEQAQKAVQLNPNYAEAQQFMAFLYSIAGQEAAARKHLQTALHIDPLSQETQFYSAYVAYMSRNYSESLQQLNACLEANPYNIPVHAVKTLCLLKMGQYEEAIGYYDNLPSEIVILGEKVGTQALGYALQKDVQHAAQAAAQLAELAQGEDGFTADSYLFLLASATAQLDKAFAWVEQAIQVGAPLLLLRYGDPLVEPIHQDPRYQQFHQQLYPTDLFASQKALASKKALLDEWAASDYQTKLLQLIEREQPYLDPDLSLRSLAQQLQLHPNQLSWLLNAGFGKNFNAFINHYRLEAFKQAVKDPQNSSLTIMSVAYDCGFNSKTVFNTYFKKKMGMTPKQFLKG